MEDYKDTKEYTHKLLDNVNARIKRLTNLEDSKKKRELLRVLEYQKVLYVNLLYHQYSVMGSFEKFNKIMSDNQTKLIFDIKDTSSKEYRDCCAKIIWAATKLHCIRLILKQIKNVAQEGLGDC